MFIFGTCYTFIILTKFVAHEILQSLIRTELDMVGAIDSVQRLVTGLSELTPA